MHAPMRYLIFLFILLYSSLAFTQVVIKDTVVIAPRNVLRSQDSPSSNQQYYLLTISISCDALNMTRDTKFSRGAVDVSVGDSSAHLANALNPEDLGRTGAFVFISLPITMDAPVQINIGGTKCALTQDSPTSFVVILDSVTVASGIYQETNPFPSVHVLYPLQQQNIYGITTLHGEAQVDPGPNVSATVTWSVFDGNGKERPGQSSDIDISDFSDVVYVKATATNKYGSTESDPVQIWIDPMSVPPGNEIYPRESGTLTITINGVDAPFFDPAQGMVLTMNGVPLLNASAQTAQIHVGQWSTLHFQLWQKGWQHALGFNYQIVESYGHINFDETDYYTAYSFNFTLSIDSTEQALPPDWLYAGPTGIEDPFLPCPTVFTSPINGELLLQVSSVSTDAVDTLFLLSPVKKFLLFQPSGYLNDTVDCGPVNAGDTVQFYLHSDMSIDKDQNMYPEIILPDTGVMASRAARSGPAGSIFPLKRVKPSPKMTAGGKLPQKKSFIEKTGSPTNAKQISMPQFAGIQQKGTRIKASQHGSLNQLNAAQDGVDPQTLLLFEDWANLLYNKIVALTWVEQTHSILLGETKYYRAVLDPNDNSKLVIEESSDPDLGQGNNSVIFEDPVAGSNDDKVGVYFDYNKSDGTGLDNGVIRLIGRYLKSDASQNYKVTLHAVLKSENRDAYIDINVKRPSSLGSTHSTAKDIKGQTYNLDQLIIDNAGQAGIFPQYIKGLISVESMGTFDPCYRYEPFSDMRVLQQKDKKTQKYVYELNIYRILSAADKGKPIIPTDHTNLRDPNAKIMVNGYPGYMTVWDYYQTGMKSGWYSADRYKSIGDKWTEVRAGLPKELFGKQETELSGSEKQIASDSTDARIFRWLQYEYQGGMSNKVAQTRLFASYGVMQVVYNGSNVYPQNSQQFLPEGLSVAATSIDYGVKTLVNKFQYKTAAGKDFVNATWSSGLEHSYRRAIFLYNGSPAYPKQVLDLLPNFMPNP